jgi:3-hydroxyisobutyrate dehydrogenase-like beta-hydroxyacid dehydrogenase
MTNGKPRIAFIGFGEAGQAIAAGLHDASAAQMTAWDILFLQSATGDQLRRAADASGVRCAASAAEAVRQAEFVVSAVTAASSVEAAESVKAHLHGKPFFLDINSVSPGRKQDSAKLLGGAARYIDVAVLAPIYPARHQTPLLIAGPDSQAVAPALASLGMRASIAGAEIGAAAAIKMVRSLMIKGIEALTLECFWPRRAPASSMRSPHRCVTIIPGSIGRKSCPTTWNGWRSMASGAPPKWRKWPIPCAS